MSTHVIPVPQAHKIPTTDGGTIPERPVYFIGRNYAAHAIEMGYDPYREPPFFFKRNANKMNAFGEFSYPPHSSDVHHEAEPYVALKSGGTNISVENARDHVYGYGLSLDMSRRDLPGEMKKMGRPWEIGKAFERSAPCGPSHPFAAVGHPSEGKQARTVNGDTRQEGDLNQMIWKVPEMISYLSEYFELAPGDIIQSGSLSGVGLVQKATSWK